MERTTQLRIGAGALTIAAAIGGYLGGRSVRDTDPVSVAAKETPGTPLSLLRDESLALPPTRIEPGAVEGKPVAHARFAAIVQATQMTEAEAILFRAILHRHAEVVIQQRALVEETLRTMTSEDDAPALIAAWETLADAQAEAVSDLTAILGPRFALFVAKEPAGPGPLALALYGGEKVWP